MRRSLVGGRGALLHKFCENGRVANAPTADLLFAHAVFEADTPAENACPEQVFFALVCEAVGASGIEPEHYTFLLMQPPPENVEGLVPPFKDLVVAAKRVPFAEPLQEFRAPLEQNLGRVGSLDFKTEDECPRRAAFEFIIPRSQVIQTKKRDCLARQARGGEVWAPAVESKPC